MLWLSTYAAPPSRSLRPHRGQPEPSRPRSRPRSFPHRAHPGPAAFCIGDGRTEKTVPRPGLPERTAALQHAKEQSGTLAIPGASQITAAAKVRVVGLRQKQTRRSLRSQLQSVPCSRRSTLLSGNCVGLTAAARLSILSIQSRNFAIEVESPPAAFLANCMVVACNEEVVRFFPRIIAVTGL